MGLTHAPTRRKRLYRSLTALAIAVLALTLLTGCKGQAAGADAPDSCEKIGEHFHKLAKTEAEALPDDHKQKDAAMAQLALLPKVKDTLVKQCKDDKWSKEVRACFLSSKNPSEFKATCATLLARIHKNDPKDDKPSDDSPKVDAPKDGDAPKSDDGAAKDSN